MAGDKAITGLVGGKLLLPERPIVCRHLVMLWTSVPEAAVHEDSDFLLGKDEIGLAEDRAMATPTGDSVLAEEFD